MSKYCTHAITHVCIAVPSNRLCCLKAVVICVYVYLCKLSDHMLEDVGRSIMKEWLQSREVSAPIEDTL